jgi:hypothetical protein
MIGCSETGENIFQLMSRCNNRFMYWIIKFITLKYMKRKKKFAFNCIALPSNDNLICECGSSFEELNSENETIKLWICKHSKCIIGHFTKPIQISKSESENEKSCSHWFCRAKAFKISVNFILKIRSNQIHRNFHLKIPPII